MLKTAIGLAAELFPLDTGDGTPATSRAHVLYLLDGHITAWSGWSGRVPEADRIRVTRLLKRRTNDFANEQTTGQLLDRLLTGDELDGCLPGPDYEPGSGGTIVVDAGMPLTDFVDGVLRELDDLFTARNRALSPAGPGHYTTTVRVPRDGADSYYTSFRFEIGAQHRDPGLPPPAVTTSRPLDRLDVPFSELKAVAVELDGHPAVPGNHRTEVVERFETSIRSTKDPVTALDLTAGSLNELLAYTGFGKSVVLIEVFACWAVTNDHVAAFVLPTNADVVKTARQIEISLAGLGKSGDVVALTSPRSRIDVAEAVTGRAAPSGPEQDWVWDRFGYGCAMAAVAADEDAVDTWIPGREPCATLRQPRPDGGTRTVACPWRTTCGRFSASRGACTANIIVTSHVNLLLGVLQTPVDDGYGVNDRLSVEELVLRRCQIVVIDEVDEFQQQAIELAGRGLVLDKARRTNTPLRKLDADFAGALGALHDDVDANVRDAYFSLRYLSENYVSHLTYHRLGPARHRSGRRQPGPGRAWIVPRRRDNWLAAKLFKMELDQVTGAELKSFESLFPGEPEPDPDAPEGFAEARRQLEAIVGSGVAGAAITAAREAVSGLVEHLSVDDRREFADWVLRRAMLERIRGFLHRLMANNSQLVDAGVESAQEVADALGTYGRWRATPTGPLGRLVFAFNEYFDDTGTEPASLSTAAFGGDPHSYTVTLGDVTALAHAGTRRIVLGLSATSYFPGAPHHHLHTTPKWWVPDASPGKLRIETATVLGRGDVPERISGLDGPARSAAVRRIAAGLWNTHLAAEFRRLAQEDSKRQRVLLATTSYAAAREVAEGLAEAGVNPPRICLAVPPRSDAHEGRLWRELQSDRLEEFPSLPGADILIAPLARVQRGVNILGKDSRSALGSVWLIVRPVPVIDEPAELVAHIQSAALAEHPGPATDPLSLLAARRREAGQFLDSIFRCPPYFQAQPERVKLGVAAEIMIGAIQLIGRARRGGTPAVLHLVDGAFHTADRGTDLASLINRLRGRWRPDQLDAMTEYYGDMLQAFLDYAAEDAGERE
ncbi:hypothetical protein FPZ12_013795 [Amycolatopsis acidicola]|uniref:Helicase ATP-binding domain-containing protein n=1 Tax=Amycolatopsis acidicola TaxID=2596893 RepID=A0A5N0V6M3_9PSEU|nr:hypothetical protein FPZ12_013795 [Amycolatopsis acidicola]